MDKEELNPEFIEKMNEIKKEKRIKVDDFRKRYNLYENKLEISKQTKKDMKKSREDYKKGKVYSLEEVKKIIKK